MRRVFVLGFLFAGMHLIRPLGSPGLGSESLLAFGFLILAAYAAGELASDAHIPKLVGYVAAGVVFGPYALKTVTAEAVANLSPVSSLAIALIAFLAGAELRWSEVRARGLAIVRILTAELLLALVAIAAFLLILRNYVSFLKGNAVGEVIAFSLVFASIAIAHSPAVTMALLSETKANGPVSRTSLGVVLISDVVIVLLLTGTLAVARALVPPEGANIPALTIGAVAWEVIGAAMVGIVLGALTSLYLRFIRRELFLFAMLVAFFGSEIAGLLRVEPLLVLIVAGFVTENFSRPEHAAALREAMERAAAPVFVVFFALAGAGIALPDLTSLWFLVLPLAVVRAGAMWTGCRLGIRWSGLAPEEHGVLREHLWAGLVPQAGVAIGLATVVARTYPNRGGQIQALFLALVAVNQVVGPILYRRALVKSGEVPSPGPAAAAVAAPDSV